jgi:tetratricopeptide (TPR) repeat protein
MRFRTFTALCVTSFVAGQAIAQVLPPPRAANPREPIVLPPAADRNAAPRRAALLGDDGKAIEGVRLASAGVSVAVRGPLVETTLLLTFRNQQNRVLGGELTLPLPEGATVAGYGIDVNGVMVDGVAVGKQQARQIYEKEIRKSVDPGIVEHVGGNNFRTRVFPIAPNGGTRTVKITYVSDLAAFNGRGRGAAITLPIGIDDTIDSLDIDLLVENTDGVIPLAYASNGWEKGFQLTPGGYVLKDSLKQQGLPDLIVALRDTPQVTTTVQRRLKSAATVEDLDLIRKGGPAAARFDQFEHFFVVTDAPQAPDFAKKQATRAQNVLVVWDASLSRAQADTARDLKILESALAKLGQPTLDVVILRNDTELHRFTAGGEEGARSAIDFLSKVTYDGATNLAALKIPKNVRAFRTNLQTNQLPKDYDLALLFTDGLATIGKDAQPVAEVPVYAVTGDASANHSLLRALSQKSGGAYVNLQRATPENAVGMIGESPFSIIGIEYDPAKVTDVSPGVGTAINQRITVSGKLLAPEATITLVYGQGKQETSRQTFTLSAERASEGSLLARFWATQKSAELQLDAEKNKDELTKLGKEFGLVTPYTSLLVLETVDQYVQHRVVPPKSRAEVYQQFLAKIEENRATQEKTREEKLQQVAMQWKQKVEWWEKEYKYPADLRFTPPASKGENGAFAVTGAGPVVHSPQAGGAASQPMATAGPAGVPPPTALALPAEAAPARPAPHPVGSIQDDLRRDGSANRGIEERTVASSVRRLQLAQAGERRELEKSVDDRTTVAAITIKPWDPNTPYIQAMKKVPAEQAYGVYLEHRKDHLKSPAFFFDCADYLIKAGRKTEGLRVLSDVVELQLEDPRLTRIVAHRLQQIGELDAAIDLFERVLALRPEEPQSYRDLALALADRADHAAKALAAGEGNTGQIASDYARSLELLNKVIERNWDRFEQIELIALMEANRIADGVAKIPNLSVANPMDGRLRKNLDCDVRIVLTWDADQTDIDLWVTEPSGETCIYNHNRTTIGGAMSRDFTQGYGPEEYALRKVMPGEYKIQANYYGSNQAHLTGPCTVQATVITHFGRPNEQRQTLTLRLGQNKETVTVGTVTLK